MINNINEVCEKIIGNITNKTGEGFNILLNMKIWDWSQGVALYGIYKYYKATNNKECLNYLIEWFEEGFKDLPVKNVNTMAPLLTLVHLYEEVKDERYINLCRDWANWVVDEMPKTEDGGLQHITIDSDNEQQLWADTLFMTVLFLAKTGSVLNCSKFTDEAKKQFLVHIRYLSDKTTGLWYHGWTFIGRHNFAKAFWGRGNCWFTSGVVEFFDLLETEDWLKDYLLDAYRSQVKALKNMQHKNGMWHTLIDDPTSYVETSATAGFTYGILKGVRMNYLPEEYKAVGMKGAEAVLRETGEDGIVKNVSYGTVVSSELDYYKRVSLKSTGYGQALTLLMLVELLNWKE